MLKFLIILTICCTIGGCNRAEQRQAQSDAHEGVVALVALFDSVVGDIRSQAAAIIAQGVHANIEGATAVVKKDLPPPQTPASIIIQQPQSYADDAEKRRDNIMSGSVWAWFGGGLLVLFGVLKTAPGTAGFLGGIVHRLIANRADMKTKQQAEDLQKLGLLLVRQIEKVDDQSSIADLKQRLDRKMSDGLKDVVNQIVD